MTALKPKPVPTRAPAGSCSLLPRTDPITRLPVLVLNPHSRCNCRCAMCDIWRAKGRSSLEPADVARWAPEWQALGVRRVMLTGGEPLLHPNLWPLCESLQAAGIGITLLTTGLLLKRHAANVVRYCDDVVVSLDGPEQVHDEIRGLPGAFARLEQGVEAVLAIETGGTGSRVSLSGRCTVQAGNCHALRATVSAARGMGLERISFLAADVSSEAFNRPGGWDSERTSQVALDGDQLAILSAELAAMERELALEFATGFIAESPVKLRQRLYGYFAALRGLTAFPTNFCNAPWVSSVIETDGTVRPCFFQPPIGNIHEAGSLEAVLNAPSAIAFRRRLDVGTDPICRKCVCTLALRESE